LDSAWKVLEREEQGGYSSEANRTNARTPHTQIKLSGIRHAGNGLFLRHGVPANRILAEYHGDIIGLTDADKLKELVCFLHSPICQLFFVAFILYLRRVRKGKATHVIRIGDSLWCFNSAISSHYPMAWYVHSINVAGFANTMPRRAHCNARARAAPRPARHRRAAAAATRRFRRAPPWARGLACVFVHVRACVRACVPSAAARPSPPPPRSAVVACACACVCVRVLA
jgi:hypothetical protein